MDLGDIYCIEFPSNKKYIGQAKKYLKNGKKWGYKARYKQHIYEATYKKQYSILLNNAIRKYNIKNMKLILLKECPIIELDDYEKLFIKRFNTLSPNGYNLMSGGNSNKTASNDTLLKMSQSMLGKNKGKIYPKRPRQRNEDNTLPKYLRYYTDKTGKEGYRISNHPILKDKSFVSKKLPLDKKLELAMEYLSIKFND